MFKKIIVGAALLASVASAGPVKIVVDSRGTGTIGQKAEKEVGTQMSVDRLRLYFSGDLGDGWSLALRSRFDKPMEKVGFDGVGAGLDYYYVQQKVSKEFTWLAGKFWPKALGWELSETPDSYLHTQLVKGAVKNDDGKPTFKPITFLTGVQAKFSFSKQLVSVHLANSGVGYPEESTAQQYPSFGVRHDGKYADGKFMSVFSFNYLPTDKIDYDKGQRNIGAGFRYKGSSYITGFEFGQIAKSLNEFNDCVSSVQLLFRGNKGKFRPDVKFFYDMRKEEDKDLTISGVGSSAALYYYPMPEKQKDLRLNAGATVRSDLTKDADADASRTDWTVFAGFRAKINLMGLK
jgi:hypothetical protein